MTDKEFDQFFSKLLQDIYKDLQESFDSIKKYSSKEYDQIKNEYKENLNLLSKICHSVNSIDDLAEMDEETIDFVYECIYDYASNFVISLENKEKDLQEYKIIEEILYMFIDEDDDYDED